MSTIARRVAEELHAYGDIPITDLEVEQALTAVHDRVHAPAGRRTRTLMLVAAAAVLGVVAVMVGAGLVLRSQTAPPANDPVATYGTLVVEYWSHPLWGHNGMVWVYDDGRVITSEYEGPTYRVRRLTVGGLDLLLHRVARLYDGVTTEELRHPCVPYQPCRQSVSSVIEVHGVHYNVSDNQAVSSLLFEMESQLPDDVWRQRKSTLYVPPAYEACYGSWDSLEPPDTTEQSSLLDGLPQGVRDLLAATPTTQTPDTDLLCSRLTPSEAATVAGAVGLRLGHNNSVYSFETVDGSAALVMNVILPHGASGSYGG